MLLIIRKTGAWCWFKLHGVVSMDNDLYLFTTQWKLRRNILGNYIFDHLLIGNKILYKKLSDWENPRIDKPKKGTFSRIDFIFFRSALQGVICLLSYRTGGLTHRRTNNMIVIWLLMNKIIGITFLQKWLILTLGLKTVVSVSTMTNFLFAHLQIYFLSIFL